MQLKDAKPMSTKISVVIPTRNEEENIVILLSHFNYASKELTYETIVVDDSTDRTAAKAERAGAKVIKGRDLGLGQAIIDGINASTGDIVVVMDADLSHRPTDVPRLLQPILTEGYDMTIGSRYVKDGKCVGWSLKRRIISRVACLLALPITSVKDATSGFFAFRKSIIEDITLKPSSWKVMLEILTKASSTLVKEIPITFDVRAAGKSKFNTKQMLAYIKHLALLGLYKHRWIKFGMVGAAGALIHFTLLYIFTERVGLWYILSAVLSIIVASTFNYVFNHKWSFRDYALRSGHAAGWGKYQILSAITDAGYLGLLALFVEIVGVWYILSAVLSIAIIFPIKYIVAISFIWKPMKRNPDSPDYEWTSFYKGNLIQRYWKGAIAKTIWNFVPNASSLLNVGCGSSPISSRYSNSVNVDINKGKLAFLKEKLPSITAEAMSAETLDFADESFDYVLCVEVLEHLSKPEVALSEIARVLKIGGRAVLATPDYNRPLWYIAERFTPYKEGHVTRFTRTSLEQLCEQYGLSPIRYKYIAFCDLVEMFGK